MKGEDERQQPQRDFLCGGPLQSSVGRILDHANRSTVSRIRRHNAGRPCPGTPARAGKTHPKRLGSQAKRASEEDSSDRTASNGGPPRSPRWLSRLCRRSKSPAGIPGARYGPRRRGKHLAGCRRPIGAHPPMGGEGSVWTDRRRSEATVAPGGTPDTPPVRPARPASQVDGAARSPTRRRACARGTIRWRPRSDRRRTTPARAIRVRGPPSKGGEGRSFPGEGRGDVHGLARLEREARGDGRPGNGHHVGVRNGRRPAQTDGVDERLPKGAVTLVLTPGRGPAPPASRLRRLQSAEVIQHGDSAATEDFEAFLFKGTVPIGEVRDRA